MAINIILIIVFIIALFIKLNSSFFSSFKSEVVNYNINGSIKSILENKFSYFSLLSEKEKYIFIKRVVQFLKTKNFIGGNGFQITNEMKVLVAAAANQITFGIEEDLFSEFNKIIIYEDIYLNRYTNNYHKGDVSTKGVITLSWKHFLEGYKYPNDKINLGIHEMAHVLLINRKRILYHQKYSKHFFDKFLLLSRKAFYEVRDSEKNEIREYAKTNYAEFFSVISEIFFEAPSELKRILPDLYVQMCIFFNQDPELRHFSSINIKDYYKKSNIPTVEEVSINKLLYAPKTDFTSEFLKSSMKIFSLAFIAILTFTYNNAFEFIPWVILISIVFFLISIVYKRYFKISDIMLFNDFLQIKKQNYFSNSSLYLNYENIISIIDYNQDEYEIKYIENENICNFPFRLSLGKSELVKLHLELFNKNVRF